MFTDLHPNWRFTKPPLGVRTDPHHRLAPYICWLLNEGAGSVVNDAVTGIRSGAFSSNPPTWTMADADSGIGSGRSFSPCLTFVQASSQSITITPTRKSAFYGNAAATMAVLFRTTSTLTTAFPYGEGDSATNNAKAQIRVNTAVAGTVGFLIANDAAGSLNPSVATSCNDGKWHWAIGVNEGVGGFVRLYYDGVLRSTSIANALGTAMKIDQAMIGAKGASTPASFFDGDVSCVFTWNRALGAAEVADFTTNPFQMFLPLRPTLSVNMPAVTVIARRTQDYRIGSRIAIGGL